MSILAIAVFTIGWIYSITAFGFFLGLGLGWIPALFIAWIFDIVLVFLLAGGAISLNSDPARTERRMVAKRSSQISDIENGVAIIFRHTARIRKTEKESTDRGVEYAMKFQERYSHFLGSFSDADLKLVQSVEKILAQGIEKLGEGSEGFFSSSFRAPSSSDKSISQ